MDSRPIAHRRRRDWHLSWLCVVFLFVPVFSLPATAAEFLLETPDGLLVFETEAARTAYEEWSSNGGRRTWLYFVDSLMIPCLVNDHGQCQKNMAEVFQATPQTLKDAKLRIGERTTTLMLAVRNGQFLYAVAPSFRMLRAIVAQSGGCSAWESRAAALLGIPNALETLKTQARVEVEGRWFFRESRQLQSLMRATSCGAAG